MARIVLYLFFAKMHLLDFVRKQMSGTESPVVHLSEKKNQNFSDAGRVEKIFVAIEKTKMNEATTQLALLKKIRNCY